MLASDWLHRSPSHLRLALAVLTAGEGDKRQARKIVNAVRASGEIEKTNPSSLTAVHAQLGELEEAMTRLTLAADSHEGGFAKAQVDPMLAPLVETEAFHALVSRFGLTARQRSAFP